MDKQTNNIDMKAIFDKIRISLIKRKKMGRNKPCLCGSGKKFKKCCLKEIKNVK